MDLMREEWEAWQKVVKEFGKVVGDMDSPRFKPLVSSIQVWGEMLHKLRATQTKEVVAKAWNTTIEDQIK